MAYAHNGTTANAYVAHDNRRLAPAVALRAYVVVFLVVWISGVVWTTMLRHHGSSIIVGVVFCAFGGVLGYRLLRLRELLTSAHTIGRWVWLPWTWFVLI